MASGITPAQRAALARIRSALSASTYLAGGVAVALHCRHRLSHDLDLFTPDDPVATSLQALQQVEAVTITSQAPGTLYLDVGRIPASVLRYAYPTLQPPEKMIGVSVPVASVPDLVTMKLAAIVNRSERRDYWDLHQLLELGTSLPQALAWFKRRYPRQDVGHVVRAIVYFADAEAAPEMPRGLTLSRWDAIKAGLMTRVRAL